jgi:hypothetical protein
MQASRWTFRKKDIGARLQLLGCDSSHNPMHPRRYGVFCPRGIGQEVRFHGRLYCRSGVDGFLRTWIIVVCIQRRSRTSFDYEDMFLTLSNSGPLPSLHNVYYSMLQCSFQVYYSSFSLRPKTYARPHPATLTAQRPKEAPRTTPRTVNFCLNCFAARQISNCSF